MKPHTLATLILCLLAAACSSVNPHGVDTRHMTVTIYHTEF